jgi:D-alanyl-lipoteichoic acid acyltransferase DltB (MBOAT superfamily)
VLFNSYEFIFVFLPSVLIVYFLFNSRGHFGAAKIWLILASLFFYSWWSVYYLPLIIFSICINYLVGIGLNRPALPFSRKSLLIIGLIFNIGLLCYFKYADFFIANINVLLPADIPLQYIALPLAISFYTFQQIAYLVDNYRGQAEEENFLDYARFVLFFPQLISGPIVRHREIMGQHKSRENKKVDFQNIATGIFISL